MARRCECFVSQDGTWYGYCPAMQDAVDELPGDLRFIVDTGLSLAETQEDWQGCINDEKLQELTRLIAGQHVSADEMVRLNNLIVQSMRGRRCSATSRRDGPRV